MNKGNILDREIEEGEVQIRKFAPDAVGGDPETWLLSLAEEGMTLLAHADDGVIWGTVRNRQFDWPDIKGFQQVALCPETLQMARLFDANTEIFLWRLDEGRWQARLLYDGSGTSPADAEPVPAVNHYFDEAQVLWGTGIIGFDATFSQANDGEEQFHHAPPVGQDKVQWGKQERGKGDRRLRLHVRHYLEEDEETGWLRIGLSRLFKVDVPG
jgi:CRISPR-associated protein (TIGR03984 family)